MGISAKKPLLPAPTDSGSDLTSFVQPDDLATDVSRRTDRTSYSVPDDGTPVVIPTRKINRHSSQRNQSQTSLLIEYFEGAKTGDGAKGRPSVRVKIRPSSKKARTGEFIKASKKESARKPSYTRRVSLSSSRVNRTGRRSMGASDVSQSEVSNMPGEFDAMNTRSEVSSLPPDQLVQESSEVSALPTDSLLDKPLAFSSPKAAETETLEPQSKKSIDSPAMDTLKAPVLSRSRSASRERIAQKVMEKLAQDREVAEETSTSRKLNKTRVRKESGDSYETDMKPRSRKSSRSHRDSGTDSSVHQKERDSDLSSTSRISNNPKLMGQIEDIVRRMVMPNVQEIHEVRRQRSAGQERDVDDSRVSDVADTDRRLSKSTSAPNVKPKVVLNRDEYSRGEVLSGESSRRRKDRRSSGESRSSRRRDSVESRGSRDIDGERRWKHRSPRRDSDDKGDLTKQRLEDHDIKSRDRAIREKRKQRSIDSGRSGSRTNSIANTDEEYYDRSRIPPMPMQGQEDSDITRTSLLSIATGESVTERPTSREIATREVSRGSPTAVPLPESSNSRQTSASRDGAGSTRSASGDKTLRSGSSSKDLASKAKFASLTAAGLGGAAGGLYGYNTEKNRDKNSRHSRSREGSSSRSPTSSLRGELKKGKSNRSVSSLRSELEPDQIEADVPRGKYYDDSEVSAQLEKEQQRGARLESPSYTRSVEGPEEQDRSWHEDDDIDEKFFENQKRINDSYRSSREIEATGASAYHEPFDKTSSVDSFADQGSMTDAREVRDVGANPQLVGTPLAPESAVASLVSSHPSGQRDSRDYATQSGFSSFEERKRADEPPLENDRDSSAFYNPSASEMGVAPYKPTSKNRWNALLENARSLSNTSKEQLEQTSQPNLSSNARTQEIPKMGISGLPDANDPLPDFVHMPEGPSPTLTNPSLARKESVVEEPLGDQRESRDHWPYEPTPEVNRQHAFEARQPDRDSFDPERTLTEAAVSGLGIGVMADQYGPKKADLEDTYDNRSQSSASIELNRDRNLGPSQHQRGFQDYSTPGPLPRDEGYVSTTHPKSPESDRLSFSKPPPQLFDASRSIESQDDPFVSRRDPRYLSGDSHGGVDSPMYEAATGRGMNHIRSKDVVALMDHLTVRDGHRNARDTEILVTLVRSAAEMNNNFTDINTKFDDLKSFVASQNQATMRQIDQGHDRTVNKILSGPRPQPHSAPRTPSQSQPRDLDEPTGKKQNIFKRALKGLGSKSTQDLSRIEDMLAQLLEEVEVLKASQGTQAGSVIQQHNSVESYERLRQNADSGYEPEGQAGTSTTPSQSRATMSPQQFRTSSRMHSGYDTRRDSEKRPSTVIEEGEPPLDDYDENDDGMQTPTQEAQRQRDRDLSFVTPQQTNSQEVTPNTGYTGRGSDSKPGHKSYGSAVWKIPAISRWSKTTASSLPEPRDSLDRGMNRDSYASRSGSEIDVLPPNANGNGPYIPNPEDRIRSAESFNRALYNEDRKEPMSEETRRSIEDPKYRATRNSLTLEHPQPRQGSTRRHQSHLEYEAYNYAKDDSDSPVSPNSDTFGSVPSLARYPGGGIGVAGRTQNEGRFNRESYNYNSRYSANPAIERDLSPISSEGGYSAQSGERNIHQATTAQAPPRRATLSDKTPPSNTAAKPTLASPSGVGYDGTSDDDEARSEGSASAGPRDNDVASAADSTPRTNNSTWKYYQNAPLAESSGDYCPIPLERKRSPYSPGGLLAPIEERYSMEGDRSDIFDQRDQQQQQRDKHHGYDIAEGDEEEDDEDRAATPRLEPRPAVQTHLLPQQAQVRKITGPREMPGASGARNEGLRGTVRRKPLAAAHGFDYD